MSRRFLIVFLLISLLLTMAACGATATPEPVATTGTTTEATAATTTEATEAPATEATEAPATGNAEEGPFTIGISNGFVASEWRTQMIQDLEETNAELMEQGLTTELIIESADVDVQGQIQQIQNLINRGVDAIIVNPNDQTALNPIFEEAAAAGIVVVAVDQEVSSPDVINVVIDQKEWAEVSARWLAEELGGKGDVVLIEGFVGHPANEARMEGVEEVFAEYPDIKVVGRQTGQWDQATGQQVMSDFLASVPNIDGVWTQDGMAFGVLQALVTADPEKWPVVAGEARAGYMHLWDEVRKSNPDFRSIGVVNPPGAAASGLRVAVEILKGGQVDQSKLAGPFGNSLYLPTPEVVTEENFEAEHGEIADQPDSYVLDSFITQEEAAGFMQK